MSQSLFSTSWYRVAGVRPRLRSHAQIHRHVYRGTVWYVLQNHSTGKFHRFKELPDFTGGLVGYAGYDTARYYEPDKLTDTAPKDDRRLPDLSFGLYNELVIFDHVDKTIKVVANADVQGQGIA